MQNNYDKRRKLSKLKASLLTLILVLFASTAMAQTNVYMHSGTQNVSGTLNFYDSGGASSTNGSYYWEKWYQHNENATITFKNGDSPIQVSFGQFHAWDDNETGDDVVDLGLFSLRINNDHLYVYDGESADASKLICDLTGTLVEPFTITTNGPITFKFVSDGSYRDEGWAATVTSPNTYTVQKPIITKETCSDYVILYNTANGGQIYYTTDGNDPDTSDPLSNSTLYTNPFAIDLDASTASVTVKAIVMVDGQHSAVASHTFTHNDQRPTPGAPEINIEGNTVTFVPDVVPAGLNETYNIRYTTNGSEPSATNGTLLTKSTGFSIEWHTPNTTFKAVTVAVTCSSKVSAVTTEQFGNVTVPTPTITFDGDGKATIKCSLDGATIYYTTNGSTPTPSSSSGTTPVTTDALNIGTTVYAYAVFGAEGYDDSAIASAIYVPASGTGTYGGVVFLDDREEHNWSYYSDENNPIRSLNPADIKITYYGNGKMYTSTTATPSGSLSDATGVKVSASENQDTFIYLKTLERANGDAGTGNLAYTLIPNPFTVRPKFTSSGTSYYTGFYGWRVKRLNGVTISGYSEGSIIPAETEVQFVTTNAKGNEVELEAVWARAYVVTSNTSTGLSTDVGYERNFIYLSSNTTLERRGFDGYNVTYTTVDPATGSGTKRTLTFGTRSYNFFYCRGNTKFENAVLDRRNTDTYLEGNAYDLIIGRGITCNNTISRIYGYYGEGGNVTLNGFNLRIESGSFTRAYLFYGSSSTRTGSANTWKMTLGCDYDRAKKTNTNLTIAQQVEVAYGFNLTSASGTVKVTAMSGTFGSTGDNTELYMGYEANSSSYNSQAPRFLEVLGGVFQGGIAGGIERGVTASTITLTMRIKGGTINQYLYGSGQHSTAYGSRRTVITGGTFTDWVAGGCYGTDNSNDENGVTEGNTYIYFGGKAKQTDSDEGIFGSGYGNYATADNRYTVQKSFVVVADEAQISGNVYGGGNNGYCTDDTEVWVLGGGEENLTVSGSVFGGANMSRSGGANTVIMEGGTVNGSVYGGAQGASATSDIVYVTDTAAVTISGGTIKNNVFGGGYGSRTVMRGNTYVTVTGGTINNNVYGGGEQGTVGRSATYPANTSVTIKGGTVNEVYGAGKGTSGTNGSANIIGSTAVSVEGGTVNGSVYGGGQNGTVAYTAAGANNTNYNSTVGVKGGEVKGNVYGGGKMGTSQVATFVNISDGIIRGHVFGGAEGEQKKVFVTGQRTVNMTGGHVYGNVYGGSQNANDGNNTTLADSDFANSTATNTICVTNISAGIIDENVYAAGYFGNCFGSVYVFLGKDAINNAPYKSPTTGIDYKIATLSITGTVWAGGDWGTFSGNFGDPTISGNSNIYVDGNSYETTTTQVTNAQYMNIGGSILACGTSCHAGKAERTVIIRNYGTAAGSQPTEASRTLYSIQFAKVLIFDNSNLNLTGQGRANDLNQTEKYSIYEIYNNAKTTNVDTDVDGVRIVNGAGLFLNAPVTQIANFRSMSCENTFASTQPTLTGYTAITPTTLSSCNNQVRVNGGNYIEIKWGSNYGALIGYAHMMASTSDSDGTCAYARPRWETNAQFEQNGSTDNPNDGGWISYTASENTFALDGTAGTVQMPYENHTVAKNGEQYFRIWRAGGMEHYREGIFDAHASGTDVWKTVDVTITLPAFRDPANYYCFEANGDATTIDYGADVLMWNAARETGTGDDWMYFNEDNDTQMSGQAQSVVDGTLTEMKKNANVNFGLVILPSTGMAGSDYIICYEADNNLADTVNTIYTKSDNTKEPQVKFRLTYYDKLSSNMTWDPSTIVLVQKDANGKTVDRVIISLAVSTSSSIEQQFTTQLYAIMQGKGSTSETFNAKVVLPSFAANLYTPGVASNFKLTSVNFVTANGGNLIARGGTYTLSDYAVGYAAGLNYDNTDGWNGDGNYTEQDAKPMTATNPTATSIGKTGGRTEFAIDFTLHYDGSQTVTTEELIGTLTFNFTFDNYKDANGNEVTQPLTIVVEVYRRGQGNKFYLDGINGSNANDARHPDKAVKQLSTIFNRCKYMAGDEIYIVNQVTANKQLDWNGLPYSNVIIYRYNGGHELSASDASIIGNADNDAYLGNLLNVTNHMTMEGITLDGYYRANAKGENPETSVTSEASMVTVAAGGTLELSQGTVLKNNNSSSVNGAAVYVTDGGKLMMNKDAQIKDNLTSGDGGGVYMAGTMVVSDDVQIVNNKKGTAQNNVYLASATKTITIGTTSGSDTYGALSADANIGVTKALGDSYTSVVKVDAEVDKEWLETPFNSHPNDVIYHDGRKYQLVKYTDPKILYWVGTWVTLQDHKPTDTEGGWSYPDDITGVTSFDITTEYQYAWIISLVNGENNQPGNDFAGKTVNILADIDMDESIWVPIGNEAHPFKGTINGNGHLIENMHSSLVQNNMGMIGIAENATIQDVMTKVEFKANAANVGAVAGTMKGTTTISNVEAGGILKGGGSTVNLGGLVGNAESGTIHSAMAVADTLVGTTTTVMGGLVGYNGGNLYNSFANTYMTGSNKMGGLVGENKAGYNVENCYVNLGQMEIPAFAYTNKGNITYCYASKAGQYVSSEVEGNVAPSKSGIFAAVKGIKEIGYMYGDNNVTNATDNGYVKTTHEYLNYHTVVWDGLLSVLNQWVADGHTSYSTWNRPLTQGINGDLPILAFPKDNCVGNFAEEDGKFLYYSASDEVVNDAQAHNGLDALLTYYSGKAANIYLYKSAVGVTSGSGNANLFIHEDAALIQNSTETINATVGVTFDNSNKSASDYFEQPLTYDWHLFSSSLTTASMGTAYGSQSQYGGDANITKLEGNYLPNGLLGQDTISWDLYTYYEPEYHWINFKRGSDSHWHYDEPHDQISYNNESTFTKGKGYMMAISQDSYLNNTGTLTNEAVTVQLTADAPNDDPAPGFFTYDRGSNLVGNPYHAYLDLEKVSAATTAGGTGYTTFYIYDAEGGVYAPFKVGMSSNPVTPSQYIHPHQGFFVVTDTVTNPENFTITYDMATATADNGSYFRGNDRVNYPLVNLFAENEHGNRDLTIIEFNRPEIGGAVKINNLRNANFKVAAHLNGQGYGLLFAPEGTERVPVHFRTSENGTFTLTWSTYNGDFTSLLLVDNMTGMITDMLRADHYTFDASTEDYASRFYITYRVTDLDEMNEGDGTFAWFDGSEWIIEGQGTLDVVDVLGRTLYSERLVNDKNRVSLNNVAPGVYLLRVSNGTNTMVQKIVVR